MRWEDGAGIGIVQLGEARGGLGQGWGGTPQVRIVVAILDGEFQDCSRGGWRGGGTWLQRIVITLHRSGHVR